jgi:PAS domain-containing protein
MISLTSTISAVAEAIDNFARRETVRSAWNTADWAKAPEEIVSRSFFSAGVESGRFLSEARAGITAALDGSRDAYGRLPDREKFIADLRGVALRLGLGTPDKPNDLNILAGARRLGIVWDMNVNSANGRARRASGLSKGALFAAPAQELVRGRSAMKARDWKARWEEAGAEVGWEGALRTRFVALKTSPIWVELSRFGTPWAPFDFGSGMILRNISRDQAVSLGLLKDDEILEPDPDPAYNDGLAATMQGVPEDVAEAVQALMPDRVERVGNDLKWRAA